MKVTLYLAVHTLGGSLYDSANSTTIETDSLTEIEATAQEMLAIFVPLFPGKRLTVTAKPSIEVVHRP